MENTEKNNITLVFGTPDPLTNMADVQRILPDNRAVSIGKVKIHTGEMEGIHLYVATDNNGKPIQKPTSEFNEIEDSFRKYAKELSMQEFMNELIAETEQKEDRSESLTKVRNKSKSKNHQINR